jgi:hypothetical protein
MKDIPSSNFQKKAHESKTTSKFANQFYDKMVSMPKKAVNVKNPDQLFQTVPVPDKYKEFVQPSIPVLQDSIILKRAREPVEEAIAKTPNVPLPLIPLTSKVAIDGGRIQELSSHVFEQDPKMLQAQAKDVLKYVKKFSEKQFIQNKSKVFDPNLAKRPGKKVIQTAAIPLSQLALFDSILNGQKTPESHSEGKMMIEEQIEAIDESQALAKPKLKSKYLRNTGSSSKTGNASAVKPLLSLKYYSREPEVEWWDLPYLAPPYQKEDNQSDNLPSINGSADISQLLSDSDYLNYLNRISNQPLPNLPKFKPESKITALKLIPTKDEQRKFKRKEKLEKQLQIQEKIKYGLLPAPAPRVKYSNLLQVYGTEAVLNPTEVEQKVSRQIDERQQKHIAHNQANSLTKEKKKEKVLRKAKRDAAKEIRITLIVVKRLTNYEHQSIISRNAKQYYLNGFAMIPTGSAINLPAIVAFEGGPRFSNKMKKLLLDRIKWQKNSSALESKPEFAALLWEGTLPEHKLKQWRTIKVQRQSEFVSMLKSQGLENFVNLILNFKFE